MTQDFSTYCIYAKTKKKLVHIDVSRRTIGLFSLVFVYIHTVLIRKEKVLGGGGGGAAHIKYNNLGVCYCFKVVIGFGRITFLPNIFFCLVWTFFYISFKTSFSTVCTRQQGMT